MNTYVMPLVKGFTDTENHLNEWNYLPGNTWEPISKSATPDARQPFYGEMAGAPGWPSDAPGPEELLQQADGEQALERAFLQLDPAQRTLLVLRAEGHDLAAIEAITGIGREVLRARLHRARRSLAQRLNEQKGAADSAIRAGSRT